MICWGVDPGYARLGYGIVKFKQGKIHYCAHGVIETHKDTETGERLVQIEKGLKHLMKKYPPKACAIEQVFFRKDLTTGVKLLQARGVILLTLAKCDTLIYETSPTSLKKMITGYGNAEKKQMQQMITRILSLSSLPEPDDAADALALAISAALRYKSAATIKKEIKV